VATSSRQQSVSALAAAEPTEIELPVTMNNVTVGEPASNPAGPSAAPFDEVVVFHYAGGGNV